MWFWIWLALFIAALVYIGVVLWWLWRRGTHLVRITSDAAERLGIAFDEDYSDEWSQPRPVVALGDIPAARAYREQRRQAKIDRRRARYDRHRERWRSWLSFNE